MRTVQKDDTLSSMEDSQQLLDGEDEKQVETVVEIHTQNMSKETYNLWKKLWLQQDIDREILKALSRSSAAPDEDEAFFISVIPAVWRMSEEKKLDFRMSVLQLIKYINNRRKQRLIFEATFSFGSTSTSWTTTPLFAIMDTNQVNQLPHLLQADQFSYHLECNSSSNVKTATASGYTFQSVWNLFFINLFTCVMIRK